MATKISDYIASQTTQPTYVDKPFFLLASDGLIKKVRLPVQCFEKIRFIEVSVMQEENPKYIYAYHLEKHRRRYKKTGECYISETLGQLCKASVQTGEAYWKVTFYRFPLKNVVAFRQYARHFSVRLISDEMIEQLQNAQRGFPPRDSDGWFDTKYFVSLSQDFLSVATHLPKDFEYDPLGTKKITFQIDMTSGRFCIKDADGNNLSDIDLKFILNEQRSLWLREKRLHGFDAKQSVTR